MRHLFAPDMTVYRHRGTWPQALVLNGGRSDAWTKVGAVVLGLAHAIEVRRTAITGVRAARDWWRLPVRPEGDRDWWAQARSAQDQRGFGPKRRPVKPRCMFASYLPFEWIVAIRFLKEGRMQTLFIVTGVAIGVGVTLACSALGLQANFTCGMYKSLLFQRSIRNKSPVS